MWIGCVQDLAISKRLALIERNSCVPCLNPVSLGPAVFKTFQKIAVTKKKKAKILHRGWVSIAVTQNRAAEMDSRWNRVTVTASKLCLNMPSIWKALQHKGNVTLTLKKKSHKTALFTWVLNSKPFSANCFDDGNIASDRVGQHPVCMCCACECDKQGSYQPCIPHRHICKYSYPVFISWTCRRYHHQQKPGTIAGSTTSHRFRINQ